MASQKERGIPLSAMNPKFLHTNSTSHTWPFGAVAELIDNAYDPDVRARQVWIDWTRISSWDCLTVMDNGAGMTRNRMHKMLSEKRPVKGHVPVGLYGNGFKSGSMRLGKDAIVFSKTRDSMSVGLLSQTYLAAIRAQHVLVPIVTFRRYGPMQVEGAASLQAILKHSLFKTERELFSELRVIDATGSTGTRVIIWNLRRVTNGETEFDFAMDRYDVRIRADACEGHGEKRPDRALGSIAESQHSLRAYCSILYLRPRMQIIIRGQKVRTQLVSKSLAYIANDNYRPVFLNKRIRITFGYNTVSKEQYGIMMYHRNRLIKAYERVGCQRKADSRGVGVIGVIECSFLQPTHNKQDFDNTDKYRRTIYNLGVKLEEYWNEIRYKRKKNDPKCPIPIEDAAKFPDQSWVQCDDCLKWRRLPDGIDCGLLPEKWFCRLNPDPQFRSCQAEEEPEDSDEDQRSYPKPYKRQRKTSKTQLYENNRGQLMKKPDLSGPRLSDACSSRALCVQYCLGTSGGALTSSGPLSPAPLVPGPLNLIPLGRAGVHCAGRRLPANNTPIVSVRSLARVKRKLAIHGAMETPTMAETFTMATASSPPPQCQPASTRGQKDHKPVVKEAERTREEGERKREEVEGEREEVEGERKREEVEGERKREEVERKREEVEVERKREEVEGEGGPWLGEEWEDGWAALEGSETEMEGTRPTATVMVEEEEEEEEEGKKKEEEEWRLLLEKEQQEQQDRLLELMEAASQERDRCREQVRQLRQEVAELKTKCAALESRRRESAELSSRLESLEVERGGLSSQVEQLKRELEAVRRGTQSAASGCSPAERALSAGSRASGSSTGTDCRLRSLRQSVGCLLVSFVPALNLEQVDYDSDAIDEILHQVLYEIT
ncbi:hypothetical protein AAFF_G00132370 [Aldrovandia affinis]|uniref:CW-type domain-containing protein n=1 Tax=Aldrovandia affinis TaxID=143900 RepID=A0AAD7RQF4_9TELE|nr:hypothetical protein AAFF_G00132370 [Aldrovandia affinis]